MWAAATIFVYRYSLGAIIVVMMGRPGDTITTGFTIAVVMVVAELSPYTALATTLFFDWSTLRLEWSSVLRRRGSASRQRA
jgi:hypothetical protein